MKYIGWIALGGIGVGIVAGGLVSALGADDIRAFSRQFADIGRWGNFDWSSLDDTSCRGRQTITIEGPERHVAWDGGDNVVIALPSTVHYRAGEGDDVIVRGAPEAVARVHVRDGTIELCGRGPRGEVEITLPGREFRHLTLAGAGRVTMENLAQTDINLTIAGSGTIHANGNAGRVSVTIAGSGDALLGELTMKRLDVKIAGSGNTEAAPQDDADVTIMGSGDVKLTTHPAHLTTNIMGSGRVVQAPAKKPVKDI